MKTLSRGFLFAALFLCLVSAMGQATADESKQDTQATAGFQLPTIPPRHRHARELLANSLRYIAPENKMIDPASGYPFEGWNQDPAKGLYLRSFTQLTAIGQYMELLSNIIAGACDTPFLSRKQALVNFAHLVASLRQDQRDATLSSGSLLGNFLDLATGKRLGPLAMDVEKQKLQQALGDDKAEAVWKALQAKGWIVPRGNGLEADIVRSPKYGSEHFDGPLAPFNDEATKRKIMEILDERVVMVVFIDNANLSAAAAKSIGALLKAGPENQAEIARLRRDLEQFLDDQQAGYAELYDSKTGQFYFGRDATKNRHFGWVNLQGKWVTGHVDYLVNEFRGPASFVVTRFGLPFAAIKNLGFKMKPYRMRDGREVHVLAPWEGSAFQALGLDLSMTELERPSWRRLLENVVDAEIDYSTLHKLPGFLSESYSGEGVQYTGSVGIPEITVSPLPRITDAASLYTLGPAYSVAPEKVEELLAANWPRVLSLLTEHGPWEGFKGANQEVIRFQTTAHTLSLVLGLLGTGSDHMKAYLEFKELRPRLDEMFKTGDSVDLLSSGAQVFAWNGKGRSMQSRREVNGFRAHTDRVDNAGIAFVPNGEHGANLSGGLLTLGYKSPAPIDQAVIALKPVSTPETRAGLIPTEVFCHFSRTGDREEQMAIPLPATPGLTEIKEVVITFGSLVQGHAVDLSITRMRVTPIP